MQQMHAFGTWPASIVDKQPMLERESHLGAARYPYPVPKARRNGSMMSSYKHRITRNSSSRRMTSPKGLNRANIRLNTPALEASLVSSLCTNCTCLGRLPRLAKEGRFMPEYDTDPFESVLSM